MSYSITSMIGEKVFIKTSDGSTFTGIFDNIDPNYEMILLMDNSESEIVIQIRNIIFIEKR